VLPNIGLCAGALGLLYAVNWRPPTRIIFDNDAATVLIKQRPGDPDSASARLPYAQIQRLSVVTRRDARGFAQSVDVVLVKRDGACWTLASFAKSPVAQAWADELQKQLRLDARADPPEAPPPPSAVFSVIEQGALTEIRWRRPLRPLKALAFVGVFAGLALAMGSVRDQLSRSTLFWVAAALALYGALLVASIFNALGRRGLIQITPSELTVDERGGVTRIWFRFPVGEIAALSHEFSPQERQAAILLLTEQQRAALARAAGSDASDADRVAAEPILAAAQRVAVGDLSAFDQQQLGELLARAIRQRSGRDVLGA
jgi:hypothetical protein